MTTPHRHEHELQRTITEELLPNNGWEHNPTIKTPQQLKANAAEKLTAINKERNPDFEPLTTEDIDALLNYLHTNRTPYQAQQHVTHERGVTFARANGTLTELRLHNPNPADNHWETITEYRAEGGLNRYDIVHLRNGLPVALAELKKHDVSTLEAYNQAEKYRRESITTDRLIALAPIFYVSNGGDTKYMSTLPRPDRARLSQVEGYKLEMKTWADENAVTISSIEGFAGSFLKAENLHHYLTSGTLYGTNSIVLLRYYQTYLVKALSNKVQEIADDDPRLNPNHEAHLETCGYVSHSTGSGKTFAITATASEIARRNPHVNVIILTDRTELNGQINGTFAVYLNNRFVAVRRSGQIPSLLQGNRNIILASHQTLNLALEAIKENGLADRRTVIIYEEGHRSTSGEMTKAVRETLTKVQSFAITGTPVTAQNPVNGMTTTSLFGELLHAYTMEHSIRDGNTVPLKLVSLSTATINNAALVATLKNTSSRGEKYRAVVDNQAFQQAIAHYIVNHYEDYQQVTTEDGQTQRMVGILATREIAHAVKYSEIFQEIDPDGIKAFVYATAGSEHDDEIREDYKRLCNLLGITPQDNRGWRRHYYTELRKAADDAKIDLIIVVDTFLTGYDNSRVNTLWLDKKLNNRYLIQAASRTNRPHPGKENGWILSFEPTEEQMEQALREFGGMSEDNARRMTLQFTLRDLLDSDGSGFRNIRAMGMNDLAGYIHEHCSPWYGRNPVEEMGEYSRRLQHLYGAMSKYQKLLRYARGVAGFYPGMEQTLTEEEWRQVEGLLRIIKTHFRPTRPTAMRDVSALLNPDVRERSVREFSEGEISGILGEEAQGEARPTTASLPNIAPSVLNRSRRLREVSRRFREGEEAAELTRALVRASNDQQGSVEVKSLWSANLPRQAARAAQALGVKTAWLQSEMEKSFARPQRHSVSPGGLYTWEEPSSWALREMGCSDGITPHQWRRVCDLMMAAARVGQIETLLDPSEPAS